MVLAFCCNYLGHAVLVPLPKEEKLLSNNVSGVTRATVAFLKYAAEACYSIMVRSKIHILTIPKINCGSFLLAEHTMNGLWGPVKDRYSTRLPPRPDGSCPIAVIEYRPRGRQERLVSAILWEPDSLHIERMHGTS
jgi:hypothetical protein